MRPFRKPRQTWRPTTLVELVLELNTRMPGEPEDDVLLPADEWARLFDAAKAEAKRGTGQVFVDGRCNLCDRDFDDHDERAASRTGCPEKSKPCTLCGEDDGHVAADCALADQVAGAGAGPMQAHSFTPPRPEERDFEPVPPPLKAPKPTMVEKLDHDLKEEKAHKAKKATKKLNRSTKKFPGGGLDMAEKCTQCGAELGDHAGTKCPPAQAEAQKAKLESQLVELKVRGKPEVNELGLWQVMYRGNLLTARTPDLLIERVKEAQEP